MWQSLYNAYIWPFSPGAMQHAPEYTPVAWMFFKWLIFWTVLIILIRLFKIPKPDRTYNFFHASQASAILIFYFIFIFPHITKHCITERCAMCYVLTPHPLALNVQLSSGAYFLVDSVHDWLYLRSTAFLWHHLLCFVGAFYTVFVVHNWGVVLLVTAELGGVLYNLSRLAPKSKLARQLFLVCYSLSRIPLFLSAFISFPVDYLLPGCNEKYGFYIFAQVNAMLIALVNVRFLLTQLKRYRADFGRKKAKEKAVA
eukprot:TRINITY_DN17310_c0_g1_i1.p1 TRINITY_DN17310_c0_g1~~TRINITY_DN17310_c0_g1_i1.p1  ORF type:complete len:256 (+),score=-10.26 TRINITY_DN17310_c0_g1_i1:90-857(+)